MLELVSEMVMLTNMVARWIALSPQQEGFKFNWEQDLSVEFAFSPFQL